MNQTELNYTSIIEIITDRKDTFLNKSECKRVKQLKEDKKNKRLKGLFH